MYICITIHINKRSRESLRKQLWLRTCSNGATLQIDWPIPRIQSLLAKLPDAEVKKKLASSSAPDHFLTRSYRAGRLSNHCTFTQHSRSFQVHFNTHIII